MHPQSQSPHARARQIMTYSLLALGLGLFTYFGFNGLQNASNWQVVAGKPKINNLENTVPTIDNIVASKVATPPVAGHAQAIQPPETSNKPAEDISKKEEVVKSGEVKYAEVVKTSTSHSSTRYTSSNSRTTSR